MILNVLAPFAAGAAINPQINYQGKLTDASNIPVGDGVYDVSFSIYTAAGGGSAAWTETWSSSNLWTETGSITVSVDHADCGGSGATKIAYSSGVNESSLAAGQYLWNTTKKEPAVIKSAVPASNYLCIYNSYTEWDSTDDLTNRVYVKSGLFSVMLGTVTSLSSLNFNQELWLGVTVGGDSEMIPRKKFGAVPAAFEAQKLDNKTWEAPGTIGSTTASSGAFTTLSSTYTGASTAFTVNQLGAGVLVDIKQNSASKLTITNAGDVGIGTANPTSLLDIEKSGTAKSITDIAEITNSGNAVDMDGTGSGLLFNQWYYDASAPAVADAGRIAVVAEADWTSTAGTQDSYMAFSTALNGAVSEKVRIDSSGNMGIGTTNPGALLDIGLAGTTLGTLRLEGNTSGYVQIQPAAAAGSWTMTLPGDDGSSGQFLQTNGSGVTTWATPSTVATSVPFSGLTAAGATNTIDNTLYAQTWNWSTADTENPLAMNFNGLTSGTGLGLASSATAFTGTMLNVNLSSSNANNTGTLIKSSVAATSAAVPLMVTNLGAGLSFRVNDDTGDADTTPFVVDASGNVGIGTTAPGTKLDVDGSITSRSGWLKLTDGYGIGWNNLSSVMMYGSGASGYFGIKTANTDRFRIDSAGNIGVGVTSPSDIFHVRHSDAGTNTVLNTMRLERLTSGTADAGLGTAIDLYLEDAAGNSNQAARIDTVWEDAANTSEDSSIRFNTMVAGTLREAMRIDDLGYMGIGTTAPGALLDIGLAGTTLGTMRLEGNTSGYVQIQPAAAAGSWTMTLPATDGDANQFLQTNGSGVTTWAAQSTVATSVPFSGLTAAGATNTIDNTLYAQTWNWSTADTENPLAMNFNGLTSGTGVGLASSATALTGSLQSITLSGTNVANTGNLLYLNSSGAASIAKALNVDVASTGASTNGFVRFNFSGAHTGNGFQIDDATATGTAMAINANSVTTGKALSISGNGLTTGSLVSIASTSTAAGSNTQTLLDIALSGTNGTSAQTTYGLKVANAHAGTTSTNVGGYFSASGGTTANYGLLVEAGNVGIGITAPTALFVLNTAAGNNPMMFINDEDISLPSWSGVGFVPAPNSTTIGRIGPQHGDQGGLSLQGFNESTAAVPSLNIEGWTGSNTPSQPAIMFKGYKHDGANSYTTFASNEKVIQFNNVTTTLMTLLGGGNVGIGTTTPGALLDIGLAGTTLGTMRLEGNTSGYVQIQPAAAAGSWTMTLPGDDGSSGQFLQTNGSGVTTWATPSTVATSVPFSGLTAAGATNTIDNTLYAQTWNWSTADTENPLAMNFNGLTSGTGVGLASSVQTLTGSLQSITLSGSNVNNTGNLLYLNSSGTASIAKALNVAIASTGNFSTTGGVAFNFSGAHTGTGLVLSDVTTTGTAMAINTTALTSGTGLYINGTGATGATGNLLNVYSVSTVAPTNGLVRFNFNGIRVDAGAAFQIDDISTTLATTMKVNSNSLTTGTAANINVNALTSGTGLSVVGTGTGVTGNMFLVQSASTGAATNGLARFNFTGAHTGNGVQINDVTTTGTAMAINTTALTSGTGLYLNGTSATAVTGNLLNVYSVSTAAPTNGLVRFNFNGIRTAAGTAFQIDDISTTLATTMKVNSNSLTTGTAANINVNALTSGTGLSVVGTGTGVTGNMFLVQSASTAAATNGLARLYFSGAHTGNGLQIDDATATGTAMALNANSVTSGKALSISGNALTTGSLVSIASTSTAAGSNTQTLLDIALSGTNGTSAQTTYGLKVANTHAGTTSTNVGGYFSASGGTTANYGLLVAAGNVGIGDIAPVAKLSIFGNGTTTGRTFSAADSNGGENFGILDSGVVGISSYGTETLDQQNTTSSGGYGGSDQWQSFTAGATGKLSKMSIRFVSSYSGTLYIRAGEGGSGTIIYSDSVSTGAGSDWQDFTLTDGPALLSGQKYTFQLTDSSTIYGSAGTDYYAGGVSNRGGNYDYEFKTYVMPNIFGGRLIADASGNVGIGTTNPSSAKLVVTGNIDLSEDAGGTGIIYIGKSSTKTGLAFSPTYPNYGIFYTDTTTDYVSVSPNGGGDTNPVAYFSAGGNVGIGTTNPGALLDIGLAGTTLGTLRLEGNTSGYVQIQPAAAAGSWTMTLPATDGDANQFLQTNGSGVTTWATATATSVPFSGLTAAGATNTIDNTLYAQTWNWSTADTENPLTMNFNALTSGTGLSVVGTGIGVTGNMFLVQSASIATVTNGLARFNFTGAHTGNGLQIDDASPFATAMAINTPGLTSGTGLYLNGTGATTVTGSLLNVYSVSTAAPTNGLVRFNFNGIRTTGGNAFQIDDVSTTLATTLKINSNSLTTGTAANINVNALTSGTGLSVVGTGTGVTGNMFLVQSASTGAVTNGLVRFNFTGAHTGTGLLLSDVTTTGTAMAINTTALTSGTGLYINGTSATAVTGNLLNVYSVSTAAPTNGLVRFNFNGIRTVAGTAFQIDDISTTLATTMKVNSNSLTTGTAANINVNALTSGTGLSVVGTGTGVTGNMFLVQSASTGAASNGLARLYFSGAHTGTGLQIDDATATGTAMAINANSLTSGKALSISGNNLTTGSLVSITSVSPGAASNTQTLLDIALSGANGLSTQTTYGLKVANTHTGTTNTNIAGYFSASGGATANYGLLVAAGNVGIGTTTPGALLDIGLAGTTLGTLRLEGNTSGYVQIQPAAAAGSWTMTLPATDGDANQFLQTNGSGVTTWAAAGGSSSFSGLTAAGATNTIDNTLYAQTWNWSTADTENPLAMNFNALTSGTGVGLVSTATALTGSLQSITLTGTNVANTGNLLYLNSSGTASIAKALNVAIASTGNFSTTGGVAFNFNGAHTGTGLVLSDVTTTGTAMAINTTALTSGTGLYLNGTSATAVTGNLLNVYSVSTAAPTNGLVRFNFNGIRTAAGTAFQIDDISTTLATTMKVNSNSLTTGTAANINVNALTSGTGLSVVGTGTGVTGNMFLVQSASTGSVTNGLGRFNFTGAHTGTGLLVSDVTTTGTAMAINTTALTSGTGLYLNGTSATAVTGNLLNVYSVSTAAPTNGLVRFNFNGIRTAAGTAFQIDDISTTLATTMKVNSNSLTTGTAANINVNALTSGTGLSVVGTGTGVTGNMFLVQSASTGAATNGLARFNFTGAHTGNGVQINDATTTGTAMAINTTALTSGTGLYLNGTSATAVTGSLLSVYSVSTAAPTNGLVRFNFNGIRTAAGTAFQIDDISTTLATTMKVNSNSLTTGTAANINVNALTSGTGLSVVGTGTGVTGNMFLVQSASTGAASNGLARLYFSGAHTGNGLQIDDATATGTAMALNANSVTTGKALSISGNALTTGSLVSIASTSTAAGSNTQTLLDIALSGTNGTSAQTTYGLKVANTHAGTTSTNIGAYFTASGGTTANYGLLVANGDVGIGTTAPQGKLEIVAGADFNAITLGYNVSDANNNGAIISGKRKTQANIPFSGFATWDDGANRTLYMGGGGWARPDAMELLFFTAAAYNETNNQGVERMRITKDGDVGIGTTAPAKRLDVFEAVSEAQLRVSYSGSVYSEIYTDSAGDVRMSATGGDIRVLDENFWVCSGGACASITPSGNGNIIAEGGITIGVSSATCDSSNRGTTRVEQGSTGVTDKLWVCLKTSSDTYNWVLVARGD